MCFETVKHKVSVNSKEPSAPRFPFAAHVQVALNNSWIAGFHLNASAYRKMVSTTSSETPIAKAKVNYREIMIRTYKCSVTIIICCNSSR